MPLTFVGLGLWDEDDVSVKGLAAARAADIVFAETYTAFLGGTDAARLEKALGRPVRWLTRAEVEDGGVILEAAHARDAALLVVGDSLTATTHTDLRLRCAKEGVPTRIVHGASVATAVPGLLGLANYKFGRTTTLVFPEGRYFATSPYDVVAENLARGLHTLVLLDLRAEDRRFMTASEGAALLLRAEEERKLGAIGPDTLTCVVARAGSPAPIVARGALARIAAADFGPPLHTIVVPGKLHFMEEEALAALATAV